MKFHLRGKNQPIMNYFERLECFFGAKFEQNGKTSSEANARKNPALFTLLHCMPICSQSPSFRLCAQNKRPQFPVKDYSVSKFLPRVTKQLEGGAVASPPKENVEPFFAYTKVFHFGAASVRSTCHTDKLCRM